MAKRARWGGAGWVRVGSIRSSVKTGHELKQIIFKWVIQVTGQTGYESNGTGQNGSDPFCHVYL